MAEDIVITDMGDMLVNVIRLTIAAVLLSACGLNGTDTGAATDTGAQNVREDDSDSSNDTGERDTATTCGASEAQVSREHCAALCESNDNEADCGAEQLPEYPVRHYCRWFNAVEAEIDEVGNCLLGEERPICAYVVEGDDLCGTNALWCEGQNLASHDDGAAYYIEDGKIFMIRDSQCAPWTAGNLTTCRWREEIVGEFTLYQGVEECRCACLLAPVGA